MTDPIDRLLRETLDRRAANTPPTPCLDAEIAAAFADHTLTRHERSRVDAHLAECVRCQMWVAALEKTTPPTIPRAWWRRPAIAWLAPVAAAAIALIVWINITHEPDLAPSAALLQAGRTGTRGLDSASSRRDQTPSAEGQRSQSPVVASASTPAPGDAATEKRRASITSNKSRSSASARSFADAATADAAAPQQSGAVALPQPAAPLPSRPLTQTVTLQPRAGPSSAASSESAAKTAAAPAPATETVALQGRRAERPMARMQFLARDAVIISSDQGSRWRITVSGMVQHSIDGGVTWETQSTGVDVRLTAGSSPSRAVCWLVGSGGTIVVTSDEGRTWQRLPFPESVDLVAIRVVDSDTAEIVTADGRTFRTSDRGHTWSR